MSAGQRRPFCDPDAVRPWNRPPLADPVPVRQWAEPLLRRAYAAGPVPLAGSPTWTALADNDPRKPAAVVLAALAHLEESTPDAIAARVAADWAAAQREFRQRLKEASADMSAAQDWGRVAGHVPFCVYAARRTTYAVQPLTADQIRAKAATSWAKYGPADDGRVAA